MKWRQVSLWFNTGPFDISSSACVSDQHTMFRLKHKRRHYSAERVHYSWYQASWLGHVDVLRWSSFKQCVGFGARPQHRLLFEKSIAAKQFISVQRMKSAAEGYTREREHRHLISYWKLQGNWHHKLSRNTQLFYFYICKNLSIINLMHYQNRLGLVYCIPTTGAQCSGSCNGGCSVFQQWYTVLHSHGWCIFYVQNQRGFLTFNFKSVYSAAVLRADKIS